MKGRLIEHRLLMMRGHLHTMSGSKICTDRGDKSERDKNGKSNASLTNMLYNATLTIGTPACVAIAICKKTILVHKNIIIIIYSCIRIIRVPQCYQSIYLRLSCLELYNMSRFYILRM